MTWLTSAVWCKFYKRKNPLIIVYFCLIWNKEASQIKCSAVSFLVYNLHLWYQRKCPKSIVTKRQRANGNSFFVLRYRADTQTYQPYNKDWIKEKIYVLLRRQAQQSSKWSPLIGQTSQGRGLLQFLISNVCLNCSTLFKFCFKTCFCHVGDGWVLYV